MGLRCSLLGHDFGDPEVEREREERGSEVVLTVREIAECTRCGKPNVVSENKEVTALQDGTDRDDHDEHEESDHDEHDERDHDERDDHDDHDDHDESDRADLSDEEDATPEPSTGDERDEDDAVIVDDEDADGRAHGEWPELDRPDEGSAEVQAPTEWPSVESDDEGFDARPSAGGSAAVDFGGGLAPERADVEEEEGLEYVESSEPTATDAAGGGEADAGFAKADAAPSPAEPAAVDVGAEFLCPQCGFVDDVVGSSLRTGDICPDCRKGYLAERER